jgi:TolA-binding protein
VLEYLKRGEELFSKRNYLFSLQQYQTFIDLNPNHQKAAEAQYFVGISLAGLRKYEKAVAELQKVAVNYPASQWADKALERAATYTWGDLKDSKGAVKIYEKILTDYPDSSSAPLAQYLVGGMYCDLGDFKQARLAYKQVILKYPGTDLSERAEKGLAEIAKK